MAEVYKVLILGEPKTGKSSVISSFLEKEVSDTIGKDFQLKILNVDDAKVRVQLWDIGSANAGSAFSPLFVRNASAAVIVANKQNQASIDK